MSKLKTSLFFLIFSFTALDLFAQVDTAWVRRYNGPGNGEEWASALTVDGSGNVYVTGLSMGSGTSEDYATIKYAPNGDTLWVRRHNGAGDANDRANALAVDNFGNVLVTGFSYHQAFYNFSPFDIATIKYSPGGDTVWLRHYNGPDSMTDQATTIALDSSRNVYVGGASRSKEYDPDSFIIVDYINHDFMTIKYTSNGDTLWTRRYNGPGDSVDVVSHIAVDTAGNVYVTGYSWGGGGTGPRSDYATIKYAPNGDNLWVRRYNGPGNGEDGASALAVDDSGNVYVTGYSYGSGTYDDYTTIKYAPNGDTLWVRRYDGPGNGDDGANALAVDGSGNVYVTGYSWSGTSYDYATIKYTPNGVTLWVRLYNGSGNGRDVANALAVDDSGNVYVTGYTDVDTSSLIENTDYATVKYAPNGDTLWVRRYNGPGNGGDAPFALTVDDFGNVYVTGYSWGSGTSSDYAIIKYVLCTVVIVGDLAVPLNGLRTPSDVVTLINTVFRSKPLPEGVNPCASDVNKSGGTPSPADVVTLINNVFRSRPLPVGETCGC